MKLPRLSSPLKLFSPAPAQPALGMAGIGGTMMFSSGGGGGYDPDDEGYDDFDDVNDQPVEPERRPRATRSSRATGGGAERRDTATGGRPRTTQFQPEERYWTDYLRIALPVIGLLLMIGLLWFWADRLISDDANPSEPVATEDIGLVTASTPTAPPVQIQSTPPPANTTAATEAPAPGDNQTGAQQETPPPADEQATEPPAESGATFSDGESVVVTEDVNLRPNPSTDGDPLMVVPAGEELTITGGPEEGENFVWWEVLTADGSTTGWVVEDYLEPAG